MHAHHIGALLGSGASADIFRLIDGRVLKLFRPDVEPGLPLRELDGIKHARSEGLIVAKPFGLDNIGERIGIVFEEIEGEPLIGSKPGWHIGRLRAALRDLAQCHAAIHECGAGNLPHRQSIILQVRIDAACVDPELKAIARARLAELPNGDSLCHGDFHPGNALVTPQGVAAIDWANGCAGDPAGDVARTEMLLRFGQYGPMLQRFPVLRTMRDLAADYYLRQYRRASGMAIERVEAWRLPVAISGLVKSSRAHRGALLAEIARLRSAGA